MGARRLVTVRSAKQKGSQFEYDCAASLRQKYPGILLTKQQGFVQQYDLVDNTRELAFECKRLKSLSWNQAMKIFNELERYAPTGYECYLLIQCNHQPCLVMIRTCTDRLLIREFDAEFGVPFIKHEPIKRKGTWQGHLCTGGTS